MASITDLHFADVAVTATAKEFAGIYRNKQQHEPDFDAVLQRAQNANVNKIMLTGMSLSDIDLNLTITTSHPGQCYMTIGCHPYHAAEPFEDEGYFEKMEGRIEALLKGGESPLVAFGEMGLDYDNLGKASRELQVETFKRQLGMAGRINLPLFLHCRNSFEDFVGIMRPFVERSGRKGLVHSFVGSEGEMLKLVELGLDIGVNGFSFRDEGTCEMVKAIPLNKLQIETDAPWGDIPANSELAKRYPVSEWKQPARKKKDKFEMGVMVKERNESCMIAQVAAIVAGLRGITMQEVANAAWENSTRMFRLA